MVFFCDNPKLEEKRNLGKNMKETKIFTNICLFSHLFFLLLLILELGDYVEGTHDCKH